MIRPQNGGLRITLCCIMIITWGCGLSKYKTRGANLVSSQNIILHLDRGIDSIRVGVSTFSEIESAYGVGHKSKLKHKPLTVENILPNTTYILSYPSLGMRFETHPQPRYRIKKIANVIILDSNFKGKSNEGIGIASTFDDLTSVLPRTARLLTWPNQDGQTSTRTPYLWIGSDSVLPVFKCRGIRDSSSFIIEEIEFRR